MENDRDPYPHGDQDNSPWTVLRTPRERTVAVSVRWHTVASAAEIEGSAHVVLFPLRAIVILLIKGAFYASFYALYFYFVIRAFAYLQFAQFLLFHNEHYTDSWDMCSTVAAVAWGHHS